MPTWWDSGPGAEERAKKKEEESKRRSGGLFESLATPRSKMCSDPDKSGTSLFHRTQPKET